MKRAIVLPERSGVSVQDQFTSSNYEAVVEDRARKPVLYTADGKPLGKNPQKIGFGK